MDNERMSAEGLRIQLQELMAKNHGLLRYGLEQRGLMEAVLSFQECQGLNGVQCAALLGVKEHHISYLRGRYRSLFQKDTHATQQKVSLFTPVQLKKDLGADLPGRFSFQLNNGIVLRVQALSDALSLIQGLQE